LLSELGILKQQREDRLVAIAGMMGVGKTTLAREGLAKILKDENGSHRPFRMI